MNMDMANVDAHIAEHRRRIAGAERFGPLLADRRVTAPARRTSNVAVAATGALLRAAGTALRRGGGLAHDSRDALRSREHDLAALGMRWRSDPAYDDALAAETRAARQRRRSAPAGSPPAPGKLTGGHGTATGRPRRSDGGALAHAGVRLPISPRPVAVGGAGQAGD